MSDGNGNILDRYMAPGLLVGGGALTAYKMYDDYEASGAGGSVRAIADRESRYDDLSKALDVRKEKYGPEFTIKKAERQLDAAVVRISQITQLDPATVRQDLTADLNTRLPGSDTWDEYFDMAKKDPDMARNIEGAIGAMGTPEQEMIRLFGGAPTAASQELEGGRYTLRDELVDRGVWDKLDPSSRIGEQEISGTKDLHQALSGRLGGMTEAQARTYEGLASEVAGRDGLSLHGVYRKTADGGVGDVFALRVKEQSGGFMDVPLADSQGGIRLGQYGQDAGVALHVPTEEFKGIGRGGKLTESMGTRRSTEAVADYVTRKVQAGDSLDSARDLLRDITANARDETGAPIIRSTGNEAIDAKLSTQVVTKKSPLYQDISPDDLARWDTRNRMPIKEGGRSHNPLASLSASQASSGNRTLPGASRTAGTLSLGQATGATKDVSQHLRQQRFIKTVDRKGVPLLAGIEQAANGEIGTLTAMNISYIQEPVLQELLEETTLAGLGLHEDVMIGGDRASMPAAIESRNYEIMLDANLGNKPALSPESRLAGLVDGLASGPGTAPLRQGDFLGYDVSGKRVEVGGGVFFPSSVYAIEKKVGEGTVGVVRIEGIEETAGDIGMKMFGDKGSVTANFKGGRPRSELLSAAGANQELRNVAAVGEAYQQGAFQSVEEARRALRELQRDPDAAGRGVNFLSREANDSLKRAYARAESVSYLKTQGFKDVGGRGMSFATEKMTARMAEEYMVLAGQIEEGKAGAGASGRLAEIKRRLHEAGVVSELTSRDAYRIHQAGLDNRPGAGGLIERAKGIISNNTFLLNDQRTQHNVPKHNLIAGFDAGLRGTMKESTLGLGSWSLEQALRDAPDTPAVRKIKELMASGRMTPRIAEAVTSAIVNRRGLGKNSKIRSAFLSSVESQLNQGIGYASQASGGLSGRTAGHGRRGSFNRAVYDHTRAQGGAMREFGQELMSRTMGASKEDIMALANRGLAATRQQGAAGAGAIKIGDFTRAYDALPHAQRKALIGSNPQAREAAWAAIESTSGVTMETGANIMGADGRVWYQPRRPNITSSSSVNKYGQEVYTRIDSSFERIMRASSRGQPRGLTRAWDRAEQEIFNMGLSKNGPNVRAFKGKTVGTLQQLAKPQFTQSVNGNLNITSKRLMQVGMFESDIRKMAEDLGEDPAEYLRAARTKGSGSLPITLTREPAQDLHRITSVKAFSVEQAIRERFEQNLMDLTDKRNSLTSRAMRRYGAATADLSRPRNMKRRRGRKRGMRRRDGSERLASRTQAMEPELLARETSMRMEGYSEAEISRRLSSALENGPTATVNSIKRETVVAVADSHRALRANKAGTSGFFAPKHVLDILGMDYDGDTGVLAFSSNKDLRARMLKVTTAREEIMSLGQEMRRTMSGEVSPEQIMAAAEKKGLLKTVEQQAGAADFLYSETMDYGALKSRIKDIASPESLIPGTPAWTQRTMIEGQMMSLEKDTIGRLTNSVEAIRETLRDSNGGLAVNRATEQFLGVVGETSIKSRHAGTAESAHRLIQDVHELADVLGGKGGLSEAEASASLKRLISSLYPEGKKTSEMAAQADKIAEGIARVQKTKTFKARRLARAHEASREAFEELLQIYQDPNTPTEIGDIIRRQLDQGTGFADGMKGRAQKAASMGEEIWRLAVKHKGAAIKGGLGALALSVIFGGSKNISEEEAQAAGARRSSPSEGQHDNIPTAPISMGRGGRSIRISGRSAGGINIGDASSMLRGLMPNADISMNVNDFRQQINDEYVQKRIRR